MRHYPLLLPSLALLLGVVLARWDVVSLGWLAVVLLFCLLLCFYWRKTWLYCGVFGVLYGLSSVVWDVQRVAVEPSWLGHKINITARIQEVREGKSYTRLRLKDIHRQDGAVLAGLADVYVYRNRFAFSPDMRIQTRVKFHTPHNKLNPAGFDYESYCFGQHIAVLGSVSGEIQVLQYKPSWLTQLRGKIYAALATVDDEAKGVLTALLLADRNGIPLAIDDAFAASGATHLLAISGLHIGLVAGWGFVLCWWLLTRRENWIVCLPIRALALSFGVLLAISYATLAAWPIPAQRAVLMLLAGVFAWWFRARQVPLNTMLAALICIVLFDPASVLSVSLWLSFAATTALLIWATSTAQKSQNIMQTVYFWCKGMMVVSLVAALATLPLIAMVFERFPVWSLLANALLVPMYALWILPLALLGELAAVLGLSSVAIQVFDYAAMGVHVANSLLLWMYDLPAGHLWLRADLPLYHAYLALMLLFCGILWLKQRKRIAIALLSCTLFMYSNFLLNNKPQNIDTLHVWDVGQGSAAMLSFSGFRLLLDVPGKRGSKFNGGTTVAENLRALGILDVDAIALTHAQSDHAGGILRLLASLNGVKELWLADVPDNHEYATITQASKIIVAQGGHVRWLKKGDVMTFGKAGGAAATIEVLWPPQGYDPSNGNNTSLVLAVRLATGQRLLLPGDMQKQVERQITADLRPFEVLLMPHHGSKTSSTAAFVQAVRPEVVIAQTGYRNHYGFPKAEVVARYLAVDSEILNTADGAVQLSFAADEIQVQQWQVEGVKKRHVIQGLLDKLW
ncbi:MAG: DNA internalization-related competence protein ComEC/Rec2 [Mariprofundaceae bacterium]|nr:DNA internalization-related competence protein ComEC/Rec2 [Mariprofundaceae bacterium]